MGRCCDLARSIDFHLCSASSTKEQAISGITFGLIGYGQQVQVRGPFRHFRHDHTFTQTNTGTLMVDCLEFASPSRALGVLADFFLVRRHLKKFLQARNLALKTAAETDQWRDYLSAQE
jgi:hypothetical protein